MNDTLLLPRFYTAPLSPEFTTAGDRLLKLLRHVWPNPRSPKKAFEWDEWQRWLIRSILETYPLGHPLAGELRYRQVVVVVPRQSGKSEIAGALTIHGLFLHVTQPNVVGIAGKNEQQSEIVFNRVRRAVKNPVLAQYLDRPPSGRMIQTTDGGTYQIFPADGDAAQGQPVTWGVMDELHLAHSSAIWSALTLGQSAQDKSLLLAITTAGDEKSVSLNQLVEEGRALALNPDPDSRFGYFEWSAPDDLAWNSPEAILSCNPRVAAGKVPLERIMAEIKKLPKADVERYRLCRTTRSKNAWMDLIDWQACRRKTPDLPNGIKPSVVSVEITPGSTYATFSVAGTDDAGNVHGMIHLSVPNPPTSFLAELCEQLVKEFPDLVVAADSIRGKDLLERLNGNKLRKISLNTMAEANSWFMAAVRERKVSHCGTGLLERQIKKAEAKYLLKGGYRLVAPNHGDLDSVHSFISACYFAHKIADEGPDPDNLFIF